MRPAFNRYLVTGDDFAPWQAIVEANSVGDAIAKAERLYLTDGIGCAENCYASGVVWRAVPLTDKRRNTPHFVISENSSQ